VLILSVVMVVMMVAMAVMMTVFVVVVMAVLFAAARLTGQLTAQVSRDQDFHRSAGPAGAHRYTVLAKVGQRPPTNAASDNHLNTLFAQPARKRAGLVLGRGQHLRAQRDFLLGVHFDQRELLAAAEMFVQAAVFIGNSDLHKGSRILSPG